jgi:V8-like Glu-specific endopeptidase
MKKESNGHKLGKNGQSEEEKEYFERCKQFSEIASLISESDPIVSEEEIRCEPENPSLGQNEEHEYIEEAVVTGSDDRKMVRNSAVHPYDGLGKLITTFIDVKTKKKTWKNGTAFLIAKNLIMTAAHNLFHIE